MTTVLILRSCYTTTGHSVYIIVYIIVHIIYNYMGDGYMGTIALSFIHCNYLLFFVIN